MAKRTFKAPLQMKGKKQIFSRATDEWGTPLDLYRRLDARFGFTLDPCAMPGNLLGAGKHFTAKEDGLAQCWQGHTAFVNPPYSNTKAWLEKCVNEGVPAVVLIPSRTDTRYFHDWVFPFATSIVFVKGRIKFGGSENGAPFPSVLIGYNVDLSRGFEDLGCAMRLKRKS
jgi:phage N-6-adenine-methyltransferase